MSEIDRTTVGTTGEKTKPPNQRRRPFGVARLTFASTQLNPYGLGNNNHSNPEDEAGLEPSSGATEEEYIQPE